MRHAFLHLTIALAAAVFVPASQAQSPSPETAAVVPWLQGVDLRQPSQAAFATWPTASLVERLYPLPWNRLAFARAALFQKPIVLVVTVPWSRASRRMLTDTLSDPTVQRAINAQYLTIVVSGDRRPDIRERYQSGTWPVVALLLPDGRPMLSHANPSGKAMPITLGYVKSETMLFALHEGRIYFDKWADVLKGVAEVYEARLADLPPEPGTLRAEASDQMARWLTGNVDAKHGGFAPAPKYVIPGAYEYAAARAGRFMPSVESAARDYLEKMAAGPLWDAAEGGVRRMAAAPEWGEIQPEKMLEGNGDLLRDLVFAVRARESDALREGIRGTAGFLKGRLARSGGGMFNAVGEPPSPGSPGEVDRLVLAGTNAMAGAALIRAGLLLDDASSVAAGRGALDLVLERAWSPARGVAHVIEPAPEEHRFLVTHADAAFGLVDAYESTGDPRYLRAARDIAEFVANNFVTRGEAALRDHLAMGADDGLLASPKWPMAENVRMARAMARLAIHEGSDRFRSLATSIVGAFAHDCTAYHVRGIDAALAVEELVRDPLVVDIEGPPEDPVTLALRRAAVNVAPSWTVIRSGAPAGPPRAVLIHGDDRESVTDPAAVAAVAARLTAVVAEGR